MKLKVLSFAVLFALCAVPVMAQDTDVTLQLNNAAVQAPAPPAVQSLVPPSSGSRGWFDDFDRPDGDPGADWAQMVGDIDILSNEAYEVTGGLSWMRHTSAFDNYETTVIEFDLDPNASGDSRYGAAVIGYNSSTGEDIFVKIQNQTGLAGYSHYGFYHAHNGGSYGGWGGFGSLPYQVNGGHVTVYVDNGGDRVNFDIDEFPPDGIVDVHVDAAGLIASGLPSLLGTEGGLGLWSNGTMDNWGFNNQGPQLDPICDIKVNGQDSGAEIFVGANCDITVSVLAGQTYAGKDCEIWWGSKSPTYLQLYYSGPLMDMKDTVWSAPLPVGVGSYMVGMGLDRFLNGTKDTLFFVDTADFNVVNPPTTYEYDDGTTENLLCWSAGGDICWMHRFDTIPGGETIAEIHCIFGSAMFPNYAPGNGTPTDVFVWNDPTDDGDPSDCVLLHTEATTVQNVDLDVYNIIPLTAPLPVVSGDFYVGCNMTHNAYEYCAPIDTTTPYVWGNGYYCGTNTQGGFDPKDLMNNQYTPTEWGNYWCIRAAY